MEGNTVKADNLIFFLSNKDSINDFLIFFFCYFVGFF